MNLISFSILIITQILLIVSDFYARQSLAKVQLNLDILKKAWIWLYLLLRFVVISGQVYLLQQVPVWKVTPILAAVVLILENILGVLLLKEILTTRIYLAILLIVTALFVVSCFDK